MTARIIDGKAIAAEFRAEFAIRVERLKRRGVVPGLAVVIVGEDPASQIYVRNKALASGAIGMHSEVHALPTETTEAHLISFVKRLNANDAIHGILVQLPLPKHIESRAVIEAIEPEKDVDGFHYFNVGSLFMGEPAFYPRTPFGNANGLSGSFVARFHGFSSPNENRSSWRFFNASNSLISAAVGLRDSTRRKAYVALSASVVPPSLTALTANARAASRNRVSFSVVSACSGVFDLARRTHEMSAFGVSKVCSTGKGTER